MRVLLAWSGGKDCTLALAELRRDPTVQVVGLLTAITAAHDRISIHGVRRSILHAQAAPLGLPVFEAALPTNASNADYEAAWHAAIDDARTALGTVEAVAFGDLFLADVRAYREALAGRIGYVARFPLWGRDTAQLASEFVRAGYEAYLTCIDTTQLGAEFAGRAYDAALVASLPASVDPCGERGEFHTCVVAGPEFTTRVAVVRGETVLRDARFAFTDLVLSGGAA